MELCTGSSCHPHYYCECGHTNYGKDDSRLCHYCRKKKYFFRKHYICTNCKIGFKSLFGIELTKNVEGGQLIENINHNDNDKEKKCPSCCRRAIPVSYDFRVPKKTDVKEWNKIYYEIKSGASDFISKYSYECGGGYFKKKEILYNKREKEPWSINKWHSKKI